MKNLTLLATGFAIGAATAIASITMHVHDGNVVYECDDFYVKAGKSDKYGWSHAEVIYKNPR